jgi:hypothetical protein
MVTRAHVGLCLTIAMFLSFGLPLAAQVAADRSAAESALVVDGRVQEIFQGGAEYLVQILVRSAMVPRLEGMPAARYPAPGEYVYVHVSGSEDRLDRRAASATLPESGTEIRAFLSLGDRNQWQGAGRGWFEEASGRDRPDSGAITGTFRPDGTRGVSDLGITAQRVSLGRGSALRVTRVEVQSPAAQAGIEPGDILVAAGGVPIATEAALADAVQNSRGSLSVTVRDVRSGRDVVVKVPLPAATRAGTPAPAGDQRSLGVTSELAFYEGDAAVKVTKVEPGSPADQAGIVPGLLILEANGSRVTAPDYLRDAVNEAQGSLLLRVVDPRDRQEQQIRVRL